MPKYGLLSDDFAIADEYEEAIDYGEPSNYELDLSDAQSQAAAIFRTSNYPSVGKETSERSQIPFSPATMELHRPIKTENSSWLEEEGERVPEAALRTIKRLKLESCQTTTHQTMFTGTLPLNHDLMESETMRRSFKKEPAMDTSSALRDVVPPASLLVERKPRLLFTDIVPSALRTGRESLEDRRISALATRGVCRSSFGPNVELFSQLGQCRCSEIRLYRVNVAPSIKDIFWRQLKWSGHDLNSLDSAMATDLLRWDPPSKLLKLLDRWILSMKAEDGPTSLLDNEEKALGEMCGILLSTQQGVAQRVRFGRWLCRYLGRRHDSVVDKGQVEFETPSRRIFNYLVNGQHNKAIEVAKGSCFFNLALLIAICKEPPGERTREDLFKQIATKGKYEEVDEYYAKCIELLAGAWEREVSHPTTSHFLQGLNFLQVFGVICWYWVSPASDTLEDVIAIFNRVEKSGLVDEEHLFDFRSSTMLYS